MAPEPERGIEPPTVRLQGDCSSELSYTGKFLMLPREDSHLQRVVNGHLVCTLAYRGMW